MNPMDVLRAIDFDWATRLSDVWDDPAWDVPGLHEALRAEFSAKLDAMRAQAHAASPLGWFVVGGGGTGKTHLLGAFRRKAARRASAFVLVDMTDVRDFWETVLQGYLDSLQQRYDGHLFQHQCILRNLIGRMGPSRPAADILAILAKSRSVELLKHIQKVLDVLSRSYPKEILKHQNVVRALVCLNSDNFTIASLGMTWLQGQEVEASDKQAYGFTVAREQPRRIIEALSWLMSLSGPTVLAFDQLDPIVTEHHFRQLARKSAEEQAAAQAIITQIGGGLGALREVTCNTLVVISCVETTWNILGESTLKNFLDRYEAPRRLGAVRREAISEAIVRNRLAVAFAKHEFRPPHDTWPFRREAFAGLANSSPREVLQKCAGHVRQCFTSGSIAILDSFVESAGTVPAPNGVLAEVPPAFVALDARFEALRKATDPAFLLEEKMEAQRLAPLLQAALQCLTHEGERPPNVDAVVDTQFTGGATTSPLHARLRLIFHDERGREEHFCMRALLYSHAIAFQAQAQGGDMTQSGIDRGLEIPPPGRDPRPRGLPAGPRPRNWWTNSGRRAASSSGRPTRNCEPCHAIHQLKGQQRPRLPRLAPRPTPHLEARPDPQGHRQPPCSSANNGRTPSVDPTPVADPRSRRQKTHHSASQTPGRGGAETARSPQANPAPASVPEASSRRWQMLAIGRRVVGGQAAEAVVDAGQVAGKALRSCWRGPGRGRRCS